MTLDGEGVQVRPTRQPRTDPPNWQQGLFETATLRITAMLLLFASAAVFEANHLSSLTLYERADSWWHLQTGIWVLQNHEAPPNVLFSPSPELPSYPSSWGYDLLVALAFRTFDLRAFPVLLMVFKLALAVVTFFLAGGLSGRFWPAVALSATAQYILGNVPAGPGYGSMFLFAIELLLLNQSRVTDNIRPLFWLPALFLVWANLDVQFVYGILCLVLFLTASLFRNSQHRPAVRDLQQKPRMTKRAKKQLQQHVQEGSAAIRPATAGTLATLCAIATLATPYIYHLYGVFFASFPRAANLYYPDALSMRFRGPQDSVLLLLTMGAFLALGLRRSRDPVEIAVLAGCTMLSFRTQRDAWLAVLAALAVIATAVRDTTRTTDADRKRALNRQVLIAGGLSVVILLLAVALRIPRSQESLLAKAAQTYPVAASNYIRENHLPPPLLSPYEWGGFLIWYLPEYPLAIGGRANVPYTEYPGISQVETLLLPRNSLIADALGKLTGFREAYSDSVAVVLVKR